MYVTLYKFVRVRADPDLPGRPIHCRVCKEPLAPTDGEYVLKYFCVDKPSTTALIFRFHCQGFDGGRWSRPAGPRGEAAADRPEASSESGSIGSAVDDKSPPSHSITSLSH